LLPEYGSPRPCQGAINIRPVPGVVGRKTRRPSTPPARILPPLRGCASSSITFFPPLPNLGSPLLALTFRVVQPTISVLAANSEWQTEERFESRLARKQRWWYAIGIAGSSARRPHLRRRSAESRRERSSLPKQSTTACVVKLSWGFKLVRQGYPSALSFRDSV
jgi:hypothetical protein